MIPALTTPPQLDDCVRNYATALNEHGFCGDIAMDYATRLTLSTDNSIYQTLPQAVLFPRSIADITILTQLSQQSEFKSITFTPRGGGTGTNGQALNQGIIVDLSRYMNRILELNLDEGWVRVEAGVIKDQLNQYIKPYGYFFSPELSTSNRATLGGMINTDASGQGSLVYGKTSDHVLGLRCVLLNGEVLDTQPLSTVEAEKIAQQNTAIGRIYATVMQRCKEKRTLILDKFPKLNRFLTGYDLRHVYNDDMTTFDLTRILTGSEGSLAFITEAKLNITPLPKMRYLVNIKYDSFDCALRNATFLVQANALSVETIDSKVLNLAREDIIWESVKTLLTDVPHKIMQGINIVEFAGNNSEDVQQNVKNLLCQLDQFMDENQDGIIGYQTCHQLEEIEKIYGMRKKAVGLLGNAKGTQKPIPFVEDTAVPPECLADYILEFRALLDGHQLSYGMFGHVDAGVLHVRPALDMCDPQQEMVMKQISDEIVALTEKYGGLLWGEHGKGYRAQYSQAYFGDELYTELRRIKAVFDVDNRLNPGKICVPLGIDAPMMQVDAIKRGSYDRQIPITIRKYYKGAMECNGNGLCFNFDVNSPMCPSMKVTHDRIHSPKGRATLVREWLRLLAEQGVTPEQLNGTLPEQGIALRHFLQKIKNTWRAMRGEYDFSHEVKASMMGCLACKACSTLCPIKIDVPEFRAKFLQLYYSRYLRPAKDYLVSNIEQYTPLIAKMPTIFNFLTRLPLTATLSRKTLGMVDLPRLSVPTLQQQIKHHRCANTTLEQLESLPDQQRQSYVLIVQDAFTSYFDAKVIMDFIMLIDKMGLNPVLVPYKPNGKPQHIKGYLKQFTQTALKTSEMLNRLAKLNIPMVGVDPAIVLSYRDEYLQLLGDVRGNFNVLLVHEWLDNTLNYLPSHQQNSQTWHLFGHCTESSALPAANKQWQHIFAHIGDELMISHVGCCGMAGTYGHEAHNQENSKALYELSWQKALQNKLPESCLATGYSCRSQVKRFDQRQLKHPLQALLFRIMD